MAPGAARPGLLLPLLLLRRDGTGRDGTGRPGPMAAAAAAAGEEGLQALYRWVDAIPLSRPKRNIARDFSDAVLAAEVVKFFFPRLVQMHSYVPASSTQQKLSNWDHLNRKVLSKLDFCVPDDMIRQIVQCRPGLVEQLLLLLRQKIEEKQKQSKEPGTRAALEQISYLETGCSSKAKGHVGGGCAQASPGADRLNKSHHGYAQTCPGDTAVRLQLAEREQALLLAQETIQILQMKVRRLEQLVHLKNIRIDDLSQRLQQAECQPK
ncbi:sperm flagellar protein 1 isoform X2 [Dromaius novaehollandiae]|uniref:sperm flagellar protein 1 isoform X2 n=1 Tax=Dromaius novaehollandiae TaxID=8790 RepID=UPI0031201B5B